MRPILILALLTGCTSTQSVHRVVDGDTVELADHTHMRLAGIDCPESRANAKCQRGPACDAEVIRGQAVAQEVRGLIDGAKVEVIGVEKYDRALGYVWLTDGRDLGQWLVATGRCADWSVKYPHPRQAAYRAP